MCLSCQILQFQSEESKDRRISLLEQDVDRLYAEVVRLRLRCHELEHEIEEMQATARTRNARIVELQQVLNNERKAG